jgi:nitrilase
LETDDPRARAAIYAAVERRTRQTIPFIRLCEQRRVVAHVDGLEHYTIATSIAEWWNAWQWEFGRGRRQPSGKTGLAMKSRPYGVAVIQRPPAFYEREETLRRAVAAVDEAVAGGAQLIVFPETYVPGYPEWVWHIAPDRYDLHGPIFRTLRENAVDLAAGDLQPLQEAARRHGVTIACGIDELNSEFSRTTMYNTLVTIGTNGEILNRHRKLMPTNPERMVWGMGDGSGLRVVDTPSGRVGGLICWENYMPLARYALYAQGIEVYIAPTWDQGPVWLATMQHIAAEGRCWVIGCGSCLHSSDIPVAFPFRADVYQEDGWINSGDSVIVAPGGKIVAGPLHEEAGILYAECDPAEAAATRRTLDAAGHYSRPDVFELRVNRRPHRAAEFDGDGYAPAAIPLVTE